MIGQKILFFKFLKLNKPEPGNALATKLLLLMSLWWLVTLTTNWGNKYYGRAWNNFPASASQVVRSNLFLLGHNPFLAGQISFTSYLYKIPPPLHDVYISNKYIFYTFIVHAASNSTQEKWNAWYSHNVRQNQYYICAYNYRFSSMSSIWLNFNTY